MRQLGTSSVMLALVASIHVLNTARDQEAKTWMVGTSPTMTETARPKAQTANFSPLIAAKSWTPPPTRLVV